jgi:hypothetical protein
MVMADVEQKKSNDDLNCQLRLQLIIGIIAVPLLIAAAIFSTLGSSFSPGWSDYRALHDLFTMLGYVTGVPASAFLVVGTIAIIQRNKSSFAWMLAGVYTIGWIWRYAFSFVIFPGLMRIDESMSLVIVISNVYSYSMVAVLLYAWWSIRGSVAYRPVYYSYLIYTVFGGYISYLVTGLLVGFGSHQIWTPEEAFALRTPSLVMSIVGYIILFLFLISQLIDHRRKGSSTIPDLD